eukprot:9072143-Alexandrium_andersonii.AAC.1
MGGSEPLQIPGRGEGRLARWASRDCDLPWRVGGKISNFDYGGSVTLCLFRPMKHVALAIRPDSQN